MEDTHSYSTKRAMQDSAHLKMAYVHLHDALNELEMVWKKDNIIAHAVRVLGAIEDTLFQYVVPDRKGGRNGKPV
jgi:hypothetical protein